MTSSKTRQRVLAPIPRFAPGFKLHPHFCRYDKLELNFDLGRVNNSNPTSIIEGLRRIAKISSVFRKDGRGLGTRLEIRKKVRNRNDRWLFSGKVQVINQNVRLFLNINPTVLFAHNPNSRRALRQEYDPGGRYKFYKLHHHDPSWLDAIRATEDKKDNFIVDDRLLEARQTDWNDYLHEYLTRIRRLIVADLDRNAPAEFFTFEPELMNWTVSYAEMHYEFAAEDTLQLAQAFGRHARDEYFRFSRRELKYLENRDHEVVYYLFKTKKKSVEVCMYAKADNRLRIEVRFTKPKQNLSGFDNSVYPNSNPNRLYEFLTALRGPAAEAIEPLQCASETYDNRAVVQRADLIAGLSAVAQASRSNQILINRIFHDLMASGRVNERTKDKKFIKALEELSERGLLAGKTKNGLRSYRPKGALRKLVALLER